MSKLITLQLLAWMAIASCDPHDVETMLGGYPEVHGVNDLTFDLDPDSLDLVVAGEQFKSDFVGMQHHYGFVYFVDNSFCKTRWYMTMQDFDQGVKHIAFSPTNSRYIFGVAQGNLIPTSFFWIDNIAVQDTSGIQVQYLGAVEQYSAVAFHLTDQIGQMYVVNNQQIIFSDPTEKYPTQQIILLKDSALANVGSGYLPETGLYVAQIHSGDSQGKLARIFDDGSALSKAAYYSLWLTEPPNASTVTSQLSLASQHDTTYILLSYSYTPTSGGGSQVDIFALQISQGDDSLISQQRIRIDSTSNSECLALQTQTDGTSYALYQTDVNKISLFLLDFTSEQSSEKSGIPFTLNGYGLAVSSASAMFKSSTSQEFYLSGEVSLDGYSSNQGFVTSSISSRRNIEMLPTSYSTAKAFIPTTHSVSLVQDPIVVGNYYQSYTIATAAAEWEVDLLEENYIFEVFTDVDVDGLNAIQINLPPQYIIHILDDVTLTWDLRLDQTFPVVVDLEGDPVDVSIRDTTYNGLLFYLVQTKDSVGSEIPEYDLKSEYLRENQGGLEIGTSQIEVVWTDIKSAQTYSMEFQLEIVSRQDYAEGVADGTISVEQSSGPSDGDSKVEYSITEKKNQSSGSSFENSCTDESSTSQFSTDSFFNLTEEELYDLFMEGYGTVANYLRCYGGEVKPVDAVISETGSTMTLSLNRVVQYPQQLLEDLETNYIEQVPELTPTEAEQEEIKAEFNAHQEEMALSASSYQEALSAEQSVCQQNAEESSASELNSNDKDSKSNSVGQSSGESSKDSTEGSDSEDLGGKRRLEEGDESWERNPDLDFSLESRLRVEIIDNSDQDNDIQDKMQDYSWSIEAVEGQTMTLNFNFAYPELYGQDGYEQFIRVRANFKDFEPNWDTALDLAYVKIPAQSTVQISEAAEATVSAAGSTAQAATAATLGVNVALSGAMSQVWGMINGMQLMVNLPLFDVNFPKMSIIMIEDLITIATFDVLPSDDIIDFFLPMRESEQEDDKFSQVGYDSNLMIVNLGTLFITLVIILMIPFILCCIKPCKERSVWLARQYISMRNSMRGNLFIRYMLEGCLDITICAVLNVTAHEGFKWETRFDFVNNMSCYVLGIAVAIFPIWGLVFYCKKFAQWEEESFEEQYGAILEGLKKNHRSSIVYPLVFILRRVVLVVIAKVSQHLFFVQLSSMVGISILQISYLITYSPFEKPLLQNLDIFNEVTTIIMVDILTCFSEGNNSPIDLQMDIVFLTFLVGNIAVHLFFLVKNSVYSAKLKCKRCKNRGTCCWRKKLKKVKKQPLAYDLDYLQDCPDFTKGGNRGSLAHESPEPQDLQSGNPLDAMTDMRPQKSLTNLTRMHSMSMSMIDIDIDLQSRSTAMDKKSLAAENIRVIEDEPSRDEWSRDQPSRDEPSSLEDIGRMEGI